MIYDQRSSQILAQARQQRADFMGEFLKGHPLPVVFVIAFAVLVTTIRWNAPAHVAGSGQQTEQLTRVSTR